VPYAQSLPLPLVDVAAALNAHPAAPRRFVAQDALPAGEPYEAFIARTRCVPTRNNLHDAFNGLVWLAEPELKGRLNALQAEGYLDEIRFARAYVRGKFRQLKWGKIKIVAGLRFLQISNEIIQIALQEIDPDEYQRVRLQLIEKKKTELREKDIFRRKSKIAQFLHAKGFETNDLQSMEVPE
jgi:hypothetical protein